MVPVSSQGMLLGSITYDGSAMKNNIHRLVTIPKHVLLYSSFCTSMSAERCPRIANSD